MRHVNVWPYLIGVATLAAALLAGSAQAHTSATTQPPDGAAMEAAPQAIRVEFSTAVRVTRLRLQGPNGPVDLQSEPPSERVRSVEIAPAQPPEAGTYRIKWRALGGDGHAIAGQSSFTVTE